MYTILACSTPFSIDVEITAAGCIGEVYGREDGIMATTSHLASITSQHNEIVRLVSDGSLDPIAVQKALQNIIKSAEGKSAEDKSVIAPVWSPPTWWTTPQQQLDRARQLWPNAVLPELPVEFTPKTKSEVLLLHVPDTFDSLWDKVVAPLGYTKSTEGVEAEKSNFRLSPFKREFTQPVWVAFDPEHGKGEPPVSFWDWGNIAASEVLSALIQFPDWPHTWVDSGYPNLSGYQFPDGLKRVPSLLLIGGTDESRLWLNSVDAESVVEDWSSPSVSAWC